MLLFPITVLVEIDGQTHVIGTTFTSESWTDRMEPDRDMSRGLVLMRALDPGWPVVPIEDAAAELIASLGKRVVDDTGLHCFCHALLWKHGVISSTCDPAAVRIFAALLERWPQAYLADIHDLAIFAAAVLGEEASEADPVWSLGHAINAIADWTAPGCWLERLQDQVAATMLATKSWPAPEVVS